jgi:hypothetical protein
VVSVTIPYCRSLGFLDRSRYFFFLVAPQLYSPFQTHYFSENLVAPGIELGPLDLVIEVTIKNIVFCIASPRISDIA